MRFLGPGARAPRARPGRDPAAVPERVPARRTAPTGSTAASSSALVDIAGDYAVITEVGVGVPTIDLRVDYLRPARRGDLVARRAARSAWVAPCSVADVEVRDASGTLVAVGRAVYASPRPAPGPPGGPPGDPTERRAAMPRLPRRRFLQAATAASLAAAPQPLLWRHARAQEEIRIGALCELSGVASTIGVPQSQGMRLAVEEINKTGGILGKGAGIGGRPIKLLIEDTESKVQTGVTKAKKLVERDRVDVLTGIIFSAISLAVQEYCNKEARVPFVNAGSGNPALSEPPACGKYTFQGAGNSRILSLPQPLRREEVWSQVVPHRGRLHLGPPHRPSSPRTRSSSGCAPRGRRRGIPARSAPRTTRRTSRRPSLRPRRCSGSSSSAPATRASSSRSARWGSRPTSTTISGRKWTPTPPGTPSSA